MRIKELALWLKGKKQRPKKYRTYLVNHQYRIGTLTDVLYYVITGKRKGVNKIEELCEFGGAKTKTYMVAWKLKGEWNHDICLSIQT